MFNILLDTLPNEYGNVSIRTDFKQGLKFFNAFDDDQLTDNEKAFILIRILFNGTPPEDQNLWDFVKYYLTGGEVENKEQEGQEEDPEENKTFCFIQDSGLIFSSFMQAYNMDLTSAEMHWWKFLQLLKGLPETTQLMKVIDIRTKTIPKGSDLALITKITNAKEKYKLKSKTKPKTLDLNAFILGV